MKYFIQTNHNVEHWVYIRKHLMLFGLLFIFLIFLSIIFAIVLSVIISGFQKNLVVIGNLSGLVIVLIVSQLIGKLPEIMWRQFRAKIKNKQIRVTLQNKEQYIEIEK